MLPMGKQHQEVLAYKMKNEYEFTDCGNCCRIYFLDGSFFTIDADDLPAVSKYTWALGKRGYPVAHTSRRSEKGHKTFSLHRFLMDPEEGYDVDHVSGDKLDNRRENLRVCSHQENMFNQKLRCTNTTGYYGVSRSKTTGRYEAYIHRDGKKKYLGTYLTAEEAADARDAAAGEMFGAFARLNYERKAVGA